LGRRRREGERKSEKMISRGGVFSKKAAAFENLPLSSMNQGHRLADQEKFIMKEGLKVIVTQ
jgi:hypothetical protein